MYAIVDIAGQQFKVEKDTKVFVHRLEGTEGSKVEFDKVLLIDNDKSVVVGTPVIDGAMVTAEIIDHMKGDKVIVFKKKRRKGYRVKNGHRQYMTHIMIKDIIEKGAKKAAPKLETKAAPAPKAEVASKPIEKTAAAPKAAPAKKETAPKAAPKKAAPKAAAAKKETAPKKAATPKVAAAKKPAAKKPAAKKAAPKKAE